MTTPMTTSGDGDTTSEYNKGGVTTTTTSADNENVKPSSAANEMASVGETLSFAKTSKTKCLIVAAFCSAVVSGSVFPAMAFYFATAFEELSASVDNEGFMDKIREVAYTFMVLGVVVFVAMTLQAVFMETAALEMTNLMKTMWFRALLRQDITYYDVVHDITGEANLISINGNKYKRGVGAKLANSVQFFVTFVGCFIYSFYASWRVSLAVLAVAPAMVLSVFFLVKMNSSQTARANATYAKAGSIVNSAVSNIRTILSLNAVETTVGYYKGATEEAYNGAVSQAWLIGLANGSQMGAFLLSYLVVTLFGAYLLYDEVEASGCDPSGTVPENETCDPAGVDVFGALMGITFAAAVLPQVSIAVESFIAARVACRPAIVAINRRAEEADGVAISIADDDKTGSSNNNPGSDGQEQQKDQLPKYVIDSSSTGGLKPDDVTGDIEFHNVGFAYPTRKENTIFQDISLKIESGKTVAIVGPSGSGKSTVMQLIERFYDPASGRITLDGNNLKDLNVKWLRQHIGLVSQEPKLFAKSIRENIAAGSPDPSNVSLKEIEEAARMANAHDFISSFPDGYETQVGELGAQLSGGEKQRIALARVLVKHVRILLLDEATSALDSESEATVQQAIDKLMKLKSMTTLIIAHRLSTIKNADMIAVVSEGKVVETGTHEELIAREGQYYNLVEAQKMTPSAISTDNAGESNPSSEHGSALTEDDEDAPSSSEHGTPVTGSAAASPTEALIKLHHVHFHYPSRPNTRIFRGLSLTINRGETLAIVGPSGSGKSSIIQLLERFYDPDKGYIEYQGVDIKDLNVSWYRDQLGLVSQEPVLFDMTIEENIRYSCPDASQENIEVAAKMANAHDFITSFPEGYQTRVGTGSTLVSGGQKQRIALARALLKRPSILLLDEATSALDSESEKIVQATLDEIVSRKDQTCVVIAHRLSTIRNADRIAVIEKGRVSEMGTHDELMAEGGRYARLQQLQNLEVVDEAATEATTTEDDGDHDKVAVTTGDDAEKKNTDEEEFEVDKETEKKNAARARLLASGDTYYFLVGGVGALFAGVIFPGWGFVFAYMVEVIYTPVELCPPVPDGYGDCSDYYEYVADDMKERSEKIAYGFVGLLASIAFGFTLLFWGFGTASERMNKRVRDNAFTALLRQEVGWFDLRSPGTLTSRLADDAALLHAFAGEPIRTLILNIASCFVGVVVAFIYMWPFALLNLGILPFMAFGAEMEMAMYLGEDEADVEDVDEHSPGGIVVETLANIRTIAALTLEEARATEYAKALNDENPHPMRSHLVKGSAMGLGQFCQMWGMALMFWWGGWLLYNYPGAYTYREYLISLFALLFSLYGLALAAEGAVNREKAKLAAARIFDLIDRKSSIDPLSQDGKKDL